MSTFMNFSQSCASSREAEPMPFAWHEAMRSRLISSLAQAAANATGCPLAALQVGSVNPAIPLPRNMELLPSPRPDQPLALMLPFSINDEQLPSAISIVPGGDTNMRWHSDGSIEHYGWTRERGHFHDVFRPRRRTKAEKKAARRARKAARLARLAAPSR